MYLLLPKIVALVELRKSPQELEISTKAVQTIREFHVTILNDHLFIIIPLLLRICSNNVSSLEIKLSLEIVKTIDSLKECHSFREHAG